MQALKFHKPVKSLGQNFLQDPKIASQIVEQAKLTQADVVLEPGAGHGELTELLQKAAGRVIAVEKDPRLASALRSKFGRTPTVEVVEGDVLKVRLPTFNKVVGTPPYNISSKLVLFLVSRKPESACLVLQREFGKRLVAHAGTADYGRLSVSVQRNLNVMPILEISREAFHPKPKVDSILLKLTPKVPSVELDPVAFDEMLRGIFTQRKRVLKSALVHYLSRKMGKAKARELVGKMGLPGTRVYQMPVEDLEALCVQLSRPAEKPASA